MGLFSDDGEGGVDDNGIPLADGVVECTLSVNNSERRKGQSLAVRL